MFNSKKLSTAATRRADCRCLLDELGGQHCHSLFPGDDLQRTGRRARAQRDPDFRIALIREAIEKLVDGDIETGLSILGDYVNATVGYKALAERTGKNPKSLMRMLGPSGNPTVTNLFTVISRLKEQEGMEFDICARHS